MSENNDYIQLPPLKKDTPSDVVVGNRAKGIETIEDLKGKTVAVSSGTSSEIILEQALARAGMTMDDINTVEMTVDGMTTAMISGQIDAAASWSPNTVTCHRYNLALLL